MINKQIINLNNILKGKRNEIQVLNTEITEIEQAIETIKKFSMQNNKSALLIAMRDYSGSMGMWERKISFEIYNQIFDILSASYNKIDVRYILHNTEAFVVNNLVDFNDSQETGGTRCSPAYQKALEVIDVINNEDCDIYILHLTDGDNIGSDNKKSLDLVNELTNKSKMFMYGEILRVYYSSTLANTLKVNKNVKIFTIRNEDEISSKVQELFN